MDKDNLSENIALKKAKIVLKANRKLSGYVKQNVPEHQETQGFIQYIEQEKYLGDGDHYQMNHLFYNSCWVSKRSFLQDRRFKELYKITFESYISKKYMGMSLLAQLRGVEGKLDMLAMDANNKYSLDKLLA